MDALESKLQRELLDKSSSNDEKAGSSAERFTDEKFHSFDEDQPQAARPEKMEQIGNRPKKNASNEKRLLGATYMQSPTGLNRPMSTSRHSSELKKLVTGHLQVQSRANFQDDQVIDKIVDEEVDDQIKLDGDSY